MNLKDRILAKAKEIVTLKRSLFVLAAFLLIFLCYKLFPFAHGIIAKAAAVFRPFIIGFMVAYILNPIVDALDHYLRVKRPVAIGLVYILFIILFLFLLGVLLPAILNNLSDMSHNLLKASYELEQFFLTRYDLDLSAVMDALQVAVNRFTQNIYAMENTMSALNDAFGLLTLGLVYLVISIYMLAGFDKVKAILKKVTGLIHENIPGYLTSLDYYMGAFLRGMLVLMSIRLLEYGFLYLIVGHPYFKEMAIFSAICVFVPYLGPLMAAGIGLITGFGLDTFSFIVLVILLLVLFVVDSYVILPDVYSREINTHPVWILFAMVTGLNLFSWKGLLLSIPVLIAVRVGYQEYLEYTEDYEV